MRATKRSPLPVFLLSDGEREYQVRGTSGTDEGGVYVTLSHAYPDAKVKAGWTVQGRGVSFQVSAVDGRILRG